MHRLPSLSALLLALCWATGLPAQQPFDPRGGGSVPPPGEAAARAARDDYVRAGAYERASARDSAFAAYLRVLRAAPAGPYADSASARLKALGAAAPDTARASPYAPALRLKELGFHSAAVAKVKDVAEKDPAAPVPDAARALLADSLAWWPTLIRRANAEVRPVLEAALVALLLGGLFYGLFLIRYAEPRVELTAVEAGGADPPSGAGFTAMVLQQVDRLTRGAARRGSMSQGINVVQGPVEGLPLAGSVQAVLPAQWAWVQVVPTLLKWLSARPRLQVRGQLHKAGPRGLGLTILITRRSASVASHTLWSADFGGPAGDDPAAEAAALAETAAVWLIFHAPPRRPPPWRRAALAAPRVGTRDWASYALFRAGARAMEAGRDAAAEHHFRRALERDPANRGARVNLGTLLFERHEAARGIAMLERARDECGDDWRDSVLYPALYRLAVARYHQGETVAAERVARRLVDVIEKALAEAHGPADADWRAYAESIEVQARALHAGTWARTTDRPEVLARTADTLDELGARTEAAVALYNLACAQWIVARNPCTPPTLQDLCKERLLHLLERACEAKPAYAAGIGKDPSLHGLVSDPMVGARVQAMLQKLLPAPAPPPAPAPEPAPQVIKLLVGPLTG